MSLFLSQFKASCARLVGLSSSHAIYSISFYTIANEHIDETTQVMISSHQVMARRLKNCPIVKAHEKKFVR